MLTKLHAFNMHVQNLGLKGALFYNLERIRCHLVHVSHPYKLYSKYALYPLVCRPYTSDYSVFWQIFAVREYSCLDNITEAKLVIDCGANVGYSSAYFLSRYPKAEVIAVEPDPGNFSILATNLASYGARAKVINSAVWSHVTDLTYIESSLGLGKEWARQLRETKDGETPSLKAKDIGTLLEESGSETISILKVDVEGSEETIFSSNYEGWINRVENIVIELHGKKSKLVFMEAISKIGFDCSQFGELTVCKRRTLASTQ